jgi:hypothetical protein
MSGSSRVDLSRSGNPFPPETGGHTVHAGGDLGQPAQMDEMRMRSRVRVAEGPDASGPRHYAFRLYPRETATVVGTHVR